MKGYTVTRLDDKHDTYGKLQIELLEIGDYPHGLPTATLTWQGNKPGRTDSETTVWYAFGITISQVDSQEKLTVATKLARQIGEVGWGTQPDEIIATLKRKGYKRVVYDSRESDYVNVADVKPGLRYLDDYEAAGYSGCTVSVIAETDDEARAALAAKFLAHNGYYRDRFAQWAAAYSPLCIDRYAKRPDTTPTAELLTL